MQQYPKSDSQKSKLYTAERTTPWTEDQKRILTNDEVEALANKAVAWLEKKHGYKIGGVQHFKFSPRGNGGAWANRSAWQGNTMMFTPTSRKPWVVLHEAAHLVKLSAHPEFDGDLRDHGWVFCDIYLKLVSHFLGAAARDALKASMKTNKVRYRPKRTRNVSPEARQAASERMRKAREARELTGKKFALVRVLPSGVSVYLNRSGKKWTYNAEGALTRQSVPALIKAVEKVQPFLSLEDLNFVDITK